MTTSISVRSNAFNFLSFIEPGVDPRTGQYTVGLSLPELKTNDLCGPVVPLRLGFNPLNTINTTNNGYGTGWDLNLSRYTPSTLVLSLYTGETFKVTGRDPLDSSRLVMKEQKIPSFFFYDLGGGRYRVVHKNGLVETLQLTGASPQLAVPVAMHSGQGHGVTLTYGNPGDGRMLKTISDSQGLLLQIEPPTTTSTVVIRLKPLGNSEMARFVMHLKNDQVTEITLPTSNDACWRFVYETIRGLTCITKVWSPLGGYETVGYGDNGDEGHGFPGRKDLENLPRVTRHITDPTPGATPDLKQTIVTVRYSYSAGGENFLANNSSVDYTDDGLDNLYKVRVPYTYVTTESLVVGTDTVRSIERRFNRFHLLAKEITTRFNAREPSKNTRKTVTTTYYADDSKQFDDQVPQCQLPKEVATLWELVNDPRAFRQDKELSTYDIYGNLTSKTQANGISETTTWFPAAGVPDECPKDPHGFVRHVREKTMTPASDPALIPDLQPGAPTLRTRHRYTEQPAVNGGLWPWVALSEEILLEVTAPNTEHFLQRTAYHYINDPSDRFRHGRRQQQAVTLGLKPAYTTFTHYAYDKDPDETVQRTVETLSTDFDDVSKEITLEHSLLHGEPLLSSDDNDVMISYTYDKLLRVTSETVAPNTQYAATRTYAYKLIRPAEPGSAPVTELAEQVATNVEGVKTRSRFDGLSRTINEAREDVDNAGNNSPVFREIYKAQYTLLGQLRSETETDWLELQDLPLTTTYIHDEWDQQASVTGPDGVTVYTQKDPIAFTQTEWREGMGKTVTLSNRFEKPIKVERYDLGGNRLSLHGYKYNGAGHTVYEKDALNRETRYVYDGFDRMLKTTLPTGDEVVREYARHSRGDLPTRIGVNGILLGMQIWDGLERLIESITGGRRTTYQYAPGQSEPQTVTHPSGDVTVYRYAPALGKEPLSRSASTRAGTTAAIEASYVYDPQTARLRESTERGLKLTRTYDSNGEVKTETRVQDDGEPRSMAYVYSAKGRLSRYTDVLGQVQSHVYDRRNGRLESTRLGSVVTTFTYNLQGLTSSIFTVDEAANQKLRITLEYDALGRETLRVFDLNGDKSRLSQEWYANDKLQRRLLSEGAEAGGPVLRDERYEYDLRGRLEHYTCSGSQLPMDPYGKAITEQWFFFDALDNLEQVRTYFAGGSNRARYENDETDPTQLLRVTNNHVDYPAVIELSYDANGNLRQDEQGRTLGYDSLNRLESVTALTGEEPSTYEYDGHDTLTNLNDQQRYYRGDELTNQIQGNRQSTFMRGDGKLLAERQSGTGEKSLLLAADSKNTVFAELDNRELKSMVYSPYGYRSADNLPSTQLGFNGELVEPHTRWYLLGRGYRAYNPVLMRFHSPDDMCPFGAGGLNCYMYCVGDPINFVDPTGHVGLFEFIISAIGAIVVAVGIVIAFSSPLAGLIIAGIGGGILALGIVVGPIIDRAIEGAANDNISNQSNAQPTVAAEMMPAIEAEPVATLTFSNSATSVTPNQNTEAAPSTSDLILPARFSDSQRSVSFHRVAQLNTETRAWGYNNKASEKASR